MTHRRSSTLIPALLIVLAGFVSRPALGNQDQDASPQTGFLPAPAGTWTTAGGSPSGTRATGGRLVLEGLALQTEQDLGGALLSEPLLWQDRMVTEHADGRDRVLTIWDLATGTPLGKPLRVRGEGSLQPSLWGARLVLRSEPDRIEEYVVTGGSLRRRSTRTAQAAAGRPFLRGEQVLHERDGQLELARFGSRVPEWSVELDLVSEPCWTESAIYLLERDGRSGRAIALDPATGRRLEPGDARLSLGLDGLGQLSPLDLEPETRLGLSVGPEALWVDLSDVAERGDLSRFVGLSRWAGYQPGKGTLVHPLFASESAPALFDGSWLLALTLDEEHQERMELPARALVRGQPFDGGVGYLTLARAGDGLGLAQSAGPWAVCGTQVLGPAVALDMATGAVLKRFGGAPAAGALPTARGIVRWFEDGRLELWRRPRAAEPLATVELKPGRIELALDARGRSIEGSAQVVLDGARGWSLQVDSGGQGRLMQPVELGFLASSGGTPAFARDSGLLLLGLESQIRGQRAKQVTRLCESARGAHDLELMDAVLSEALEWDASDSTVRRLEEAMADQEARPRSPATARIEELRAGLGELDAIGPERWARALEELPKAWRPVLEVELVAKLLAADPRHRAGLALLEELLPRGLGLGPGGFQEQPLDWVQFLRQTQRIPLEFIEAPENPTSKTSADELRLIEAVRAARGEPQIGLRSANLLVITSVGRPAALAEVLALGELVTESLEEMFGEFRSAESEERELEPLELRVYGSREEYLAGSAGRRDAHGGTLSWTAGHYSLGEAVSRLYLPDGEFEAGLEAAKATFVHELTHHWIDLRCPGLAPRSGLRLDPETPGFWIVEGFASMVEEFEWDLEAWTYSARSPRADGLDLVAMAAEEDLLPWAEVLRWSSRDVGSGAREDPRRIPMRWNFDNSRVSSSTGRFYAMSEALASYLFQTPTGRRALLETLLAFYSDSAGGAPITTLLERTPEQLGAQTRTYARAVVQGG